MKRPSLKDRGEVMALFRGSEPAIAPKTSSHPDSSPVEQATGKPAQQQRGTIRRAAGPQKAAEALIKATFYLTSADLQALENARTKRRAQTGRRRGVDLSALVREAIRTRFGR